MSTRKETERAKLIQEKCQTLLTQMLRDEDNKYCVDCDAKGPRWASWNLGVFLCIRCAGIHRNLGVHISRVKSVNLDSWTPEQVVSLQQMGNSRARAVYEAQLPDGFRRPQTDSALESFIRAKYEHKKYLAREWVPPPPPKVDWAKEIDEEIEKQKRKKKSSQSGSTISGIASSISGDSSKKSGISSLAAKTAAIPAPLPKPKSSSSPKTHRTDSSHHSHHHQHHNNQNNSDLLGLSSPVNSNESSRKSNDNGADGFSNFLSAPVSNTSKSDDSKDSGINSLAKEEEDFFKQSSTGASDKDKGKLTKDSILALYGTAPQNSIGQFNNNPLVGFNSTFHINSLVLLAINLCKYL